MWEGWKPPNSGLPATRSDPSECHTRRTSELVVKVSWWLGVQQKEETKKCSNGSRHPKIENTKKRNITLVAG
jgi:hypothetical protein